MKLEQLFSFIVFPVLFAFTVIYDHYDWFCWSQCFRCNFQFSGVLLLYLSFICVDVTTSLLDCMLFTELALTAGISMQLLSDLMRFVRLVVCVVLLYLIGSFTCFLTFHGITFSPTVTTSHCGCSFFHDFLSEMLNASISFQFYLTGFLSCMPYPFDLGLFDTHKMINYPLLWPGPVWYI